MAFINVTLAGNVWYWGSGDILNINGGATIPAPRQLVQPAGKAMVKLVPVSATAFGNLTFVWGLASDGTVWQWDRTHSTPFQVTFAGNVAQDITMVGPNAFVIKTATDLLTWGSMPQYAGGVSKWVVSGIQSVKSVWQAAGCVFPIKEVVGNYNSLHIIDANDNLWACGSNVQGELGNGVEYPNWVALAWQWNWANGMLMTMPVQIPGKFKNINTGNTIAFYLYAQDMGGNWYSWGRNKSLNLGNGLTLSINAYATYPQALNVPAPVLVTPLTQTWSVVTFNPLGLQLPLANPGINQYINSATTTLYGQGSSQQNGLITAYQWTKVSGPAATITAPTTKNTGVTGLSNGTYVFQLTVTNGWGVKASRNVTVVVGSVAATNQAPIANAGADATVYLPSNKTLTGTATDADGSIAAYSWKKISGPSGEAIATPTAAQTNVTFTTAGQYSFELTVTDDKGATGKDTAVVNVNANTAPVAYAGADRTIQLPVNRTLLDGRSSTDANGSITKYQWSYVSGPAGSTLLNAAKDTSTLTFTTAGTYVYRLTVTDNGNLTATDDVQIIVQAAATTPNVAPTSNAGADASVQLPTSRTLLNGRSSKDSDGTITSYSWKYVSGPTGSTILNSTKDTTTVTFTTTGTYVYSLTVTDNGGLTSTDDVQVTVLAAAIIVSSPSPAKGVKVNLFDGTVPYNNTQWNNWNPVATVNSTTFKYTDGTQSTITANLSSHPRFADNGANYGAGSTPCPSEVLRFNSLYTLGRTITISGLSTSKKYAFEFYGARASITNSKTIYKTGNISDTISTDLNVNDYAKFSNITPYNTGKVVFTISFTGLYNYISGFAVTEAATAATLRGGSSEEPEAIEEKVVAAAPQKIASQLAISIYPNPFTSYIQVELNSAAVGKFQLTLMDMLGKRMMTQSVIKNSEFMMQRIDATQLRPGIYLLQIFAPDGSQTTQKIIKQ